MGEMENSDMKKKLAGTLSVTGLFALFVLVLCTQLFKIKANARIYPIVLMVFSAVLMIVVVIQALRKYKAEKAGNSAEAEAAGAERGKLIRVTVYSILILIYIVLIPRLGYVISTILFAVISLLYQKKRNLLLLILLPVVSALLMYFVFKNYLFVTLPAGTWIKTLKSLF